jgi:hypothetical protein
MEIWEWWGVPKTDKYTWSKKEEKMQMTCSHQKTSWSSK